ncbi:MAG: ABC transporter substrate-binding protein [Nitriliruptoraceae bacterium]
MRHRTALLIAPLLLLLAACGGASDTEVLDEVESSADDAVTDESTDEEDTAEASDDADAAEEAAGEPTAEPDEATADGPALPVTLTDAEGNEVTVEDTSRIVSLTGTTTEIIHALGLLDQVVAVDTSSIYPEEATELPDVGYQRALNAEGIIAMEPSLVLGTEAAGPPEVIAQLRDTGIPTLQLAHEDSLDTPPERIRDLATALGVPERGEELAAEVEAAITAAVERAAEQPNQPRAAFIYLRGPETILLGGAGSVSQVMLEAAGAIDAGAEAGVEGIVPLTPEALADAAPEVIVVPAASLGPAGGVEGILALPGVAQTPAGAAGRVVAVDDGALLGLGPRTAEALEDLIDQLHAPG